MMRDHEVDYTNTFRALADVAVSGTSHGFVLPGSLARVRVDRRACAHHSRADGWGTTVDLHQVFDDAGLEDDKVGAWTTWLARYADRLRQDGQDDAVSGAGVAFGATALRSQPGVLGILPPRAHRLAWPARRG